MVGFKDKLSLTTDNYFNRLFSVCCKVWLTLNPEEVYIRVIGGYIEEDCGAVLLGHVSSYLPLISVDRLTTVKYHIVRTPTKV